MKPDDLFVGVSEFFAILLPGAVLTFAGAYVANRFDVRCHGLQALGLTDEPAWWALAIVAYTVGHIVASWGSRLDVLYDDQKDAHRNSDLKKCADALLKSFVARAKLLGNADDEPKQEPAEPWIARAVRLFTKRAWSPGKQDTKIVNAYKLSRITLNRRAPTVFAEVVRLEADSKFFRSLVVVAVLTLPAWVALVVKDALLLRHATWWDAARPALWDAGLFVATLFTLRLAYARFCELRLKATETAFQGLVYLSVEEKVPNQVAGES